MNLIHHMDALASVEVLRDPALTGKQECLSSFHFGFNQLLNARERQRFSLRLFQKSICQYPNLTRDEILFVQLQGPDIQS